MQNEEGIEEGEGGFWSRDWYLWGNWLIIVVEGAIIMSLD